MLCWSAYTDGWLVRLSWAGAGGSGAGTEQRPLPASGLLFHLLLFKLF